MEINMNKEYNCQSKNVYALYIENFCGCIDRLLIRENFEKTIACDQKKSKRNMHTRVNI